MPIEIIPTADSKYLELLLASLKKNIKDFDSELLKRINSDILFSAAEGLLKDHGDEIANIIKKYGKDAVKVIMNMFNDENKGAEEYYNAMQGRSVNDLLDDSFAHFREARQNKAEFKRFLSGVGIGIGVILKTAMKTVNPFG